MSISRTSHRIARAVIANSLLAGIGVGCLDRPAVPASPQTQTINMERIRQSAVDKIDLLFMIDNSASMADKQLVLAEAVPDLLNRLVDPECVVVADGETRVEKLPDGSCPEGAQREFEPVRDIHIGVISSSLGANGAAICKPSEGAANIDMARLLARDTDGTDIGTYAGKGFLQWDPDGKKDPEGTTDAVELGNTFKEMVVGVGQAGCGYEQSLEAVYRFLVDPEPYAEIELVDVGKNTKHADLGPPEKVDEVLLRQRRDFLRPDSLVAIVSLTDENDCSTVTGGTSYLFMDPDYTPPRATSSCAEDPNSECCGPCKGWNPPSHCPAIAEDPECNINGGRIEESAYQRNLRCFDQKRRFGVEALYPVERYVDGIQQQLVPNRSGELVQNPLYSDLQCGGADCQPQRDPSLVIWAMIVGVPWQDIARVNDDGAPDLSKGYMTAEELESEGRWKLILGDPKASPPVLPTDSLMIESVDPRSGEHPITGDPIVKPNVDSPPPHRANPINGHERTIVEKDDLQYACIFELPEPAEGQGDFGQDCYKSDASQNPLCQHPQSQGFGSTQYSAKAYPGLRHLQVAKGLEDQAIVASICPANLKDPKAADYGYRPAIGALVDRLKRELRNRCLPRMLTPDVCVPQDDPTYGHVPCVIIEARQLPDGESCDCDLPGRAVPNAQVVTDDVEQAGGCVCEITQLTGAGLHQCETETDPSRIQADGWCYVDPQQGLGNPDLVAQCAASERRILRFVNQGNPANHSTVFITCQEAAFNPSAAADAGHDAFCRAR